MKDVRLTRRCIRYTSRTTKIVLGLMMTATSTSVVLLVHRATSSSRFSLLMAVMSMLGSRLMSWHLTWGLACCNHIEINKREV